MSTQVGLVLGTSTKPSRTPYENPKGRVTQLPWLTLTFCAVPDMLPDNGISIDYQRRK